MEIEWEEKNEKYVYDVKAKEVELREGNMQGTTERKARNFHDVVKGEQDFSKSTVKESLFSFWSVNPLLNTLLLFVTIFSKKDCKNPL